MDKSIYDSMAFQRAGLKGLELKKAVENNQAARVRGSKQGLLMAGEIIGVQVLAPMAIISGMRKGSKVLKAYEKVQSSQIKNLKSASNFFQTRAGGASPALVNNMTREYINANKRGRRAQLIRTELDRVGKLFNASKPYAESRMYKFGNYESFWTSLQGKKYKALNKVVNSNTFNAVKQLSTNTPFSPVIKKINNAMINKKDKLSTYINHAKDGFYPKNVSKISKHLEQVANSDAAILFSARIGGAIASDHTPKRFTDKLLLEHQKAMDSNKFSKIVKRKK